jgi:hypothetical protein
MRRIRWRRRTPILGAALRRRYSTYVDSARDRLRLVYYGQMRS